MDRPAIKFRVDEDQKKEVQEYAKQKGFDTPANLARVALFYYMRKNPLKIDKRYGSKASEVNR